MVGVMMFFATFFSYMLRNAMSINILAMVKPTTPDENGEIPVLPNVWEIKLLKLLIIDVILFNFSFSSMGQNDWIGQLMNKVYCSVRFSGDMQ